MGSNAGEALVFDVGSLFARFQRLSDKRKRRGVRYSLALIVEELEQVSSEYLGGKKFFGKQVVLAIDGKVLLGILLSKKKYRAVPAARRYFSAHPTEALDLILRL